MSGTLVFIETSDIGARYLRDATLKLGLKPLFIFREGNYQSDTLAQLMESEHLLADTRSPSDVLRVLAGLSEKPVGVLSILDAYMETASRVGAALGTSVPEAGIARSKDKGLVAHTIGDFGPQTVKLSLTQPENEWHRNLEVLLKRSPDGILLKPRFGSGALGLHFISNGDDLRQVRSTLLAGGFNGCPEADLWIAQSRTDGELVSCEGYCVEGQITVLGFTGRSKVGKTESRAYFPHDAKLSSAARNSATKALETLLAGLRIRNTYFHSEFIVADESAHLIDANIGRIGGGPIGEMVALSYGLDPTLLYAHYLLTSLPTLAQANPSSARDVCLTMSSALGCQRRDTLSLLYGAPSECELTGIQLPESFLSMHTQLLSAGGRVPGMGTNNWDWIGILTGLPEAVWTDFDRLRLETTTGVVAPVC